jgi:phage gpG-like protein
MGRKVDISNFTKRLDSVLNTYKKTPSEIATLAVNFSKERFRDQAWLDETKHNWKPKKKRRGGAKRSQTLLVDTGRLKRSIRKIKATPNQVIIGTDVPYAEIHNEGGEIKKTVNVKSHAVKSHRRKSHTRTRDGRTEKVKEHTVTSHIVTAHTREMNLKIPSRRFLGNSYTLSRRIELHITSRFMKALK